MSVAVYFGEPGVVEPLLRLLNLGDIFRLNEALCDGLSCIAVLEVVRAMSLKPRRNHTLRTLSVRMQSGRCVGCGIRCRCRPSICAECGAGSHPSVAMVTRLEIRSMINHRLQGLQGVLRRRALRPINEHLRRINIAKRGQMGRLYYWRCDVETAVRSS